jgi:non-ribosomal peptide synthetase component F
MVLMSIKRDLYAKIQLASASESVSIFMFLLAAYNVLMFRYTEQNDILVGTPAANRLHPELENSIGLFLNPLVLRTKLAPEMKFRDLVRDTREVCLQAFMHQELPFEKLIEAIQPRRMDHSSPLFQVMLNFGNTPTAVFEAANLKISLLTLETTSATLDLKLSLIEGQDGLIGFWDYKADLFDRESVEGMAEDFTIILEQVAGNIAIEVSNILSETDDREVAAMKLGDESVFSFPGE